MLDHGIKRGTLQSICHRIFPEQPVHIGVVLQQISHVRSPAVTLSGLIPLICVPHQRTSEFRRLLFVLMMPSLEFSKSLLPQTGNWIV